MRKATTEDLASAAVFRKKLDSFTKWLVTHGAQILVPTNEWELLRFRDSENLSIVYRKRNETLTFVGQAHDAWQSFCGGRNWRAYAPTKRTPEHSNTINTLLERDGDLCFFCSLVMSSSDISVEHLVPRTHGGPNHIGNKFLAHGLCNSRAGALSAVEKIRIHTRNKFTRIMMTRQK